MEPPPEDLGGPLAKCNKFEECTPLLNVEEVLSWKPDKCSWKIRPLSSRTPCSSVGTSQYCHQTQWRPTKLYDRHTVPRTLVCHDMKGGYLDDRFVHGSEKHTDYRFFHWAGIDMFVYFSHKFVTIAPPVWVNAAHLHGVLILGTIITECDTGKKILEEYLHSSQEVRVKFIQQLVQISKYSGMDGWLINIENKVNQEDVRTLHEFVADLTKAMHKEILHSQVIWYDSVIKEGKLKWQNELNEENKMFFDVCDGIFLNYVWKEEGLARSVKLAGVRALDVYVGVDIFGRNCYGGGGFNTSAAVEKARAHDMSVALFAPGWVHECWAQEKFTPLEYTFWRKLWPLLHIHGPSEFPFETSFCQGYGKKSYDHGKVKSDQPWHNLSLQMPQPCLPICVEDVCDLPGGDAENKPEIKMIKFSGCVRHWSKDAYHGGGCLLLKRPQNIQAFGQIIFHKLFLCSLEVGPTDSLRVYYAVKSPKEDKVCPQDLALGILCQDKEGGHLKDEYFGSVNGLAIRENTVELIKDEYDEETGWTLRQYLLAPKKRYYKVTEISLILGCSATEVLLGWISISPPKYFQ
ncbi:cytosolic endo-beta-N-acetylglucosaminidase isoform X2 [Neocloeon triangulifer]|uniref:cytosolic endo-beta-N-acetylglucosaminidase isoform X2 n=1 Tax=Neocloeon triangulifer TaxID=2078957 RepID=UPI00286F3382|nr:cytosolic endo-beta-N-acetylglucosaminidase isoform X2 [Neocloeon triangulifer]